VTRLPHLERAADFVATTARLLDRHRFRHLFAGGDPEPVRIALEAYANPDGGFGHALEPDLRGPDSQPAPTGHALEILLHELERVDDPRVPGACEYLLSISAADGGVPFVLPTARAHPHAPWWQTPDDPPGSLNPTASLAGLLYAHGVAHPWLDRATEFCWRALDGLEETSPYEMRAIIPFLDHVPDRERAEAAFARIGTLIHQQGLVTVDPEVGGGDKHRPYDFASAPGSLAHGLFDDATFERNLDALAAGQEDDGGWPIDWQVWTPAAGLEWRGWMTVWALTTLRAHGSLDTGRP
jgi:hypothetical protein